MKRARLLSVSDIHFGNTHIEPDRLADNFRRYVLPLLAESDIVIIAGDFFDTALALSDNITPSVVTVVCDFLAAAAAHGVIVRIMRGTFSHDRTQCQYFPILHKQYGFTNDLCYFDTISLEYIEAFDLRILYLPDDLPYPNSAAVMAVVQQKLQELGWDYVDYVIAHGYFDHVVPEGAHRPKMTYERSQFSFVRRYVLIGHVHTSTIYDNLPGYTPLAFIYNGSFDRLIHGEEEPKGFIRIDDDGHTAHIEFVQNLGATEFVTLDFAQLADPDAAVAQFRRVAEAYPPHEIAHVRVFHPDVAWRHGLNKLAKQHFPHIRLSVKAPNEHARTEQILHTPVIDFTTVTKPSEENLPALILEHGETASKPFTLTEERIRALLLPP